MRKEIKLLFLTLILIFGFTSLGICIETKYKWNIFVSRFVDSTKESSRLYTLKFKDMYENQNVCLRYRNSMSHESIFLSSIFQ